MQWESAGIRSHLHRHGPSQAYVLYTRLYSDPWNGSRHAASARATEIYVRYYPATANQKGGLLFDLYVHNMYTETHTFTCFSLEVHPYVL